MENISINKLELASELSHQKLIDNWSESVKIYEDDESESLQYSEEAQNLFNGYYDEYLELIDDCKSEQESSNDLNSFLSHIQDSATEMLEQMDKVDSNDEFWSKYAYTITTNGKRIRIDINADTFSRLEAFLKSEINHQEE
jgi:hypothetical protein